MRACKAGIVEDLRFFLRLESTAAAAIADEPVAVCRKVGASICVTYSVSARR
jgi:hypothetical protein